MRLVCEADVVSRLETVYGLRGEVKSETLQAIDICKTIDAIPTDWLDRLMQDGTPEESKAAWRVLRAWRKEQEE